MQLLKAVVIVLGVVIAIGVAALAWGLAHHWNRPPESPEATSPAPAAPIARPAAADRAPSAIDVPTPEGMHFEQMTTGAGMVLLRFSGAQGERIVVVDPRTGHVTTTISIAPAAK